MIIKTDAAFRILGTSGWVLRLQTRLNAGTVRQQPSFALRNEEGVLCCAVVSLATQHFYERIVVHLSTWLLGVARPGSPRASKLLSSWVQVPVELPE